jgi:NAD(P)H-flavin reductase
MLHIPPSNRGPIGGTIMMMMVGSQQRKTMSLPPPPSLFLVISSLWLLLMWCPPSPVTVVTAFTAVSTRTTTIARTTNHRHHQYHESPGGVLVNSPRTTARTTAGTTTTTRLFMGWGPDPIWTSAVVQANEMACRNGHSILLRLTVPIETAASFFTPGQYVQVMMTTAGIIENNKPAFMAICSAPDPENATFEFLIKKTDTNTWLTGLAVGATIQVSQVLGTGYGVKENLEGFKYDFPTQNIILVAAGSGIAPIASAIESGLLGTAGIGSSRTCTLYYGERTAGDLCFVDRYEYWQNSCGVTVVPVLSQPNDDNDPAANSYTGRQGYVQTALEEDGIPIPRNTGALLCGMKGMTESVKSLLLSAGVFEGRILFNV